MIFAECDFRVLFYRIGGLGFSSTAMCSLYQQRNHWYPFEYAGISKCPYMVYLIEHNYLCLSVEVIRFVPNYPLSGSKKTSNVPFDSCRIGIGVTIKVRIRIRIRV